MCFQLPAKEIILHKIKHFFILKNHKFTFSSNLEKATILHIVYLACNSIAVMCYIKHRWMGMRSVEGTQAVSLRANVHAHYLKVVCPMGVCICLCVSVRV